MFNKQKILGHRIMKNLKAFFVNMSTHKAVTLSVFVHILLALAFASLSPDKIVGSRALPKNHLVFELVKENKIEINKKTSLKLDNNADGSDQNHHDSIEKLGKTRGTRTSTSKHLIAEKAKINKKAAMMASLTGLSELRESFSFVLHQVSADSMGSFTPIQGTAPDIDLLSDGLENGHGFGTRSGIIIGIGGGGGGNCPPR